MKGIVAKGLGDANGNGGSTISELLTSAATIHNALFEFSIHP
jgi:hypothetical protein